MGGIGRREFDSGGPDIDRAISITRSRDSGLIIIIDLVTKMALWLIMVVFPYAVCHNRLQVWKIRSCMHGRVENNTIEDLLGPLSEMRLNC